MLFLMIKRRFDQTQLLPNIVWFILKVGIQQETNTKKN